MLKKLIQLSLNQIKADYFAIPDTFVNRNNRNRVIIHKKNDRRVINIKNIV